MLKKHTGVLNRVKTWLGDFKNESPQTHVAAQRVAGGLLIADALVGLENPFDGRKTRPGLIAHFLSILPVAAFMTLWVIALGFIGGLMDNESATEPAQAQIVDSWRSESTSTDRHGREERSSACGIEYMYQVEGATEPRTSTPGYNSSSFCKYAPGDKLEILYDHDNPGDTVPKDNEGLRIMSVMRFAPLVVFGFFLLPTIFAIFVDIAQIVLGFVLLRKAKKDAGELLGDKGFDSKELNQELRDRLLPMIMDARQKASKAARSFFGGRLKFFGPNERPTREDMWPQRAAPAGHQQQGPYNQGPGGYPQAGYQRQPGEQPYSGPTGTPQPGYQGYGAAQPYGGPASPPQGNYPQPGPGAPTQQPGSQAGDYHPGPPEQHWAPQGSPMPPAQPEPAPEASSPFTASETDRRDFAAFLEWKKQREQGARNNGDG